MNSFLRPNVVLKDFQEEAVAKALGYKRFILCLDTGMGKTLCSLAIFNKLKQQDPTWLMLVLSTKTGMTVWGPQVQKWTTFSYQENRVSNQADVSILMHSQYDKHIHEIDHLLKSYKVCLVIDEAHFLKSPDSNLAWAIRTIIPRFPRVYALTATLLLNHLEDVFYNFESMFPGIFGRLTNPEDEKEAQDFWNIAHNNFLEKYTNRENKSVHRGGKSQIFKQIIGYKNLDKLSEIIMPLMYRKQASYNIEFQFLSVMPPESEQDLYLDAAKGIIEDTKGNMRDFVGRLPDLQIIANFSINPDRSVRKDSYLSAKEKAIFQIIGNQIKAGGCLIIFTFFRASLNRLKHIFENSTLRNDFFVISGDTSTDDRREIQQQFGPGQVILATSAGTASINLQASDRVVFFDLPWSVGTFLQAVGRIARIDSTHDIFKVDVLSARDTIDDYKVLLLKANMSLIKEVLGGTKAFDAVAVEVNRKYIIEMRKTLLWKIGSRRSNPTASSPQLPGVL